MSTADQGGPPSGLSSLTELAVGVIGLSPISSTPCARPIDGRGPHEPIAGQQYPPLLRERVRTRRMDPLIWKAWSHERATSTGLLWASRCRIRSGGTPTPQAAAGGLSPNEGDTRRSVGTARSDCKKKGA